MADFDVRKRAHEMFYPEDSGIADTFFPAQAEARALQLCAELAQAIAAECERQAGEIPIDTPSRSGLLRAAKLALSFVRPRSAEEVYANALRQLQHQLANPGLEFSETCEQVIQQALDLGARSGEERK